VSRLVAGYAQSGFVVSQTEKERLDNLLNVPFKKGLMTELNNNELVLNPLYYKKYHPYLYHLKKIKWFLFGSLTWELESRRKLTLQSHWKRQRDFNGLVGAFCARFKLRRKCLAYYQATEFGKSVQPHYHFLIAANNLEHLSGDECAETLKTLWQSDLKPYKSSQYGIGLADVRPYEDSSNHPAVYYCLKREWDSCGNEWERTDFLSERLKRIIIHQQDSQKPSDPLTPKVDSFNVSGTRQAKGLNLATNNNSEENEDAICFQYECDF
jgi:hypothetical protein